MTLFKEGMWVLKKSWGCAGRVRKRLSRYVWECELVALSPDGFKQVGFITPQQVRSGEVEILYENRNKC